MREILHAWLMWFRRENEELSRSRLRVCNGCKHRRSFLGIKYCDECKCVLQAKTRCEVCECPKDKWFR
jgi:hypothetical protein